MNNAGVAEMHDRIPVSMAGSDMKHVCFLAINIKCRIVGECYDRQSGYWRRRSGRIEHVHPLLCAHPFAYILMGDHHGTCACGLFISPGVIKMVMCICDETDRLIADFRDFCYQLINKLRALSVDHKYSIFACQDRGIAHALNYMDIPGDIYDFKLLGLLRMSQRNNNHEAQYIQTRSYYLF